MLGLGFLGRLFDSPKALASAAGALRDGIDALSYTEEEKAGDARKERAAGREWFIRWMEATKGQNLARRIIALVVTGMWSLMGFAGIVFAACAIWAERPARYTETSELLFGHMADVGTEFTLVLIFYFGAGKVDGIVKMLVERQQKKE